jgi:hypothetical protein
VPIGIHVDADELHIASLVEDLLGAVAVVGIDIENGDASRTGIDQCLCRNRCIVQQAEPTER